MRYSWFRGSDKRKRRRPRKLASPIGNCPKTLRGKAMFYAVCRGLTWNEARVLCQRLKFNSKKGELTPEEKELIETTVKAQKAAKT